VSALPTVTGFTPPPGWALNTNDPTGTWYYEVANPTGPQKTRDQFAPTKVETNIVLAPELVPHVPQTNFGQLMEQRAQVLSALAALRARPRVTAEDEKFFAEAVTFAATLDKEVDGGRTAITKPILKIKSGIDDLYNLVRKPLAEIDALGRSVLRGFEQSRIDAREAAHAEAMRLAATQSSGDVAAVGAQIVQALESAPDKAEVEGIGHGAEWEWAVTSEADIPREWLCIDESKLKIYMREHAKSKHIPEVPGFKFRRVATIRRK
jgi:hypothetical protein